MRRGPIEGVSMKELVRRTDARGFFEEVIRASDAFFVAPFAQLSWCRRDPGVVTAFHFHPTQWDWWFVAHGNARVVLHDLRDGSRTRGNTHELDLGEAHADRVLAIPPGVAHGYKVLAGASMELFYVTSREYNAAHPAPPEGEEGRIAQDDPRIGYDWSSVG